MKNKNLFIVGLCIALLVTGCKDVFGPPKQEKPNAGKGYFSLAIDGARTIMPSEAVEQFVKFELEFFAEGEGPDRTAVLGVERDHENLSEPVLLDAGTYDLLVTAYTEYEEEGDNVPAAQGSIEGIVIGEGETVSHTILLWLVAEGEGTFTWAIEYPDTVTVASMTVTPLGGNGTAEQTLFFIGGSPLIDNEGEDAFLTLNAGYYRVLVKLTNDDGLKADRREILHVYQNMESFYGFTFEPEHFVNDTILVSSEADSGPGSLRQAITEVPEGGRISVSPDVKTIALNSRLPDITKSIIIEGNGVTITRADSLTASSTSQLMRIYDADAEVTITRVWFKDAKVTGDGGAISINFGKTLTLESCIFSGNSSSNGGAIYNPSSTLNLKGCTFYGNSASQGGVIFIVTATAVTNLEGCLFYGNTAATQGPVVYKYQSLAAVNSNGYNVVDVAFGNGATQSGFSNSGGRDKTIGTSFANLPMSPLTFRLLSGGGATNVIATLPDAYPTVDFYGEPITANAAAGAVQDAASGSGYYLGLSVNISAGGSLSAVPQPDEDGLVPAGTAVTITANPAANAILKWLLVDGVNEGDEIELTMTKHTAIQAVFARIVTVHLFTDASDSATTPGTLRHALTEAQDYDIIRLSGVTPGQTVITLTRQVSIDKGITIEGNGITITQTASFTTVSNFYAMMLITGNPTDTELTISRVWFKDGRGGLGSTGSALITGQRPVTVESCIFSGNRAVNGTNAYGYGAAIETGRHGTLNVKGCTFYNNYARTEGGAIRTNGYLDSYKILTLTGNLFYGNTAGDRSPVIHQEAANISSGGYNVSDVTMVNTISGTYTTNASDKIIGSPLVLPTTFRVLSGSGADNIITTLPNGYPAQDFYGDPITDGASAGAVQSTVSGLYLALSVNNSAWGSVSAVPAPDANGMVSDSEVTITATPTAGSSPSYLLKEWLVNGSRHTTITSPLTLELTGHTSVQAVFEAVRLVTNFTDASNSATTAGTLRYAVTNAKNGDTIRIATSGQTIELTSRLSLPSGTTLDGNGVTLTRAASWTAVTSASQLIEVGSTTISHVWFKGGRATTSGGAINKGSGTLTLESCIFSDNQTTDADSTGGAIRNTFGHMNVRGCTFYNNSAYQGGAIYMRGNTSDSILTLSGNLFYGNTATEGPAVYRTGTPTITSYGYNVVDVALGTGTAASGFANSTGNDKTIAALLGGDNATSPFANETTLAPKPELSNATNGIPAATWTVGTNTATMPATDFYGVARTWPGAAGAVK